MRPGLDILYVSDAGETPYGKMKPKELQARILLLLRAAKHQNISHALIACNAASTILPTLDLPIFTEGVIEIPLQKIIKDGEKKRPVLGIIGGKRTIESGAWSMPLCEHGFKIHEKIAQPFSALIEAGQHHNIKSFTTFKEVLHGLEEVTDLVLACTHYIAAKDIISKIIPKATLFDPVEYVVDQILIDWKLPTGTGETSFITSGDKLLMRKSAKLAFDIEINLI